ncbi:RNA ligase [Candidatus Micrarchaeota archaeon]|nr:RNA ligase [Candidatus Micrarchaeota archaeon]
MIGNTPYTKPTKKFDVKFYIFDIHSDLGSYLSCEEKYSLLKKYSLLSVPQLGCYPSNDYKALEVIILKLNKQKKEGFVLKSPDRSQVVKYVTSFSDIEDIATTSKVFFDMPIGFYYQRILRSAIFADDFSLNKKTLAAALGAAFYNGLSEAVSAAKEGKEISEEFEISIKNPRIWDELHHHMSKEVSLVLLSKTTKNGSTNIRFKKIYKNTTKILTAYVNGKGIVD